MVGVVQLGSKTHGVSIEEPSDRAHLAPDRYSDQFCKTREQHVLLNVVPHNGDFYRPLLARCIEVQRYKEPLDIEREQLVDLVLDSWREADIAKGADPNAKWMDYRNNHYQREWAEAHVAVFLRHAKSQAEAVRGVELGAPLISAEIPKMAQAPVAEDINPCEQQVVAPLSSTSSRSTARGWRSKLVAVAAGVGVVFLAVLSIFKGAKRESPKAGADLSESLTVGRVAAELVRDSVPQERVQGQVVSLHKATHADLEKGKLNIVAVVDTGQAATVSADSVAATQPFQVAMEQSPSVADTLADQDLEPARGETEHFVSIISEQSVGSADFVELEVGLGKADRVLLKSDEDGNTAGVLSRRWPLTLKDIGLEGSLDLGAAIEHERAGQTRLSPALRFEGGVNRTFLNGFEVGAKVTAQRWPEVERLAGRTQLINENFGSVNLSMTQWLNDRWRVNARAETEFRENQLDTRGAQLNLRGYVKSIAQPQVPNDLVFEPFTGAFSTRGLLGQYRQGFGLGTDISARHKNTYIDTKLSIERTSDDPSIEFLTRATLRQQLSPSLGVFVEHRSEPSQGSGFMEPRSPLFGTRGWRAGLRLAK